MNAQKGITLIALIITIIVMLILVAVTINVALNGGLFTRAKIASSETQKEADREQLMSAVIASYEAIEGTLNEIELRKLEANGWTITKNGNTYTCISSNKNSFTVDSKGNITIGKKETADTEDEDLDYIRTYFLGAKDKTTGERPKNIKIQTILDTENASFIFSDSKIKFDFLYDNGGINVRYKTKGYRVSSNENTGCATSVELIDNTLPEIVGKYVKFGNDSNELWVVLYDEGEKTQGAQLVSTNTLEAENVYLGNDDSIIDWTDNNIINDAEMDGQSGLSDLEKSMYSYNSAITNLNSKCRDLVGIKTGVFNVRCLGSNPTHHDNEDINGFIASSETIEGYSGTWFPDYLNLIEKIDTNNKPYYIAKKDENNINPETVKYIIKNADENYVTDIDRLEKMAYLFANNGEIYWLASRGFWWLKSDDIRPGIRFANGGIIEKNFVEYLFYVYGGSVGGAGGVDDSYGVRPVIILNSGVLSNAISNQLNLSNDGTVEKPYIIQ